jgi:transposase
MTTTRLRNRARGRRLNVVQKPRGLFHPRVQKVGPEHFGIVSIDCAKARSKWMLCDFYGNVLIPPTVVEHNRPAFDEAITRLRQALTAHGVQDLLVAVERTGRYHHLPQRAFAAAGFEVRTVHPFATKQFRQPSDPGNKTDDTDLAAIHRAAVNGFALIEPALDTTWQSFQLLVRHRRLCVQKNSALCCQIREHLEAAFPGYATCFDDLWERSCALALLRHFDSAQALRQAGLAGLAQVLRQDGIRFHQPTLVKILAWADQAAPPAGAAACHRYLALALDDDRVRLTQEIIRREREIATYLVRTPYVLLLSFPGIHVVSAAEFGGEMGPISHYANAKAITGRAGLFPSRHQSDQVDHPNGPLVRCCNRRLRAAILGIADNLMTCNQHFRVLAESWRTAGKDSRHSHVKVALRFCRIAYQLVAGQQMFRHPSVQQRSYVLDKLLAFQREHDTPMNESLTDLQNAIEQIPTTAYPAEARPLSEELQRIQEGHRRGPQVLGDILPIVLARLGVPMIQSTASGEPTPR